MRRLRRLPLMLALSLLVSGCGAVQVRQGPTLPTTNPAAPTPAPSTAAPRPLAELPLDALLFQPGDLPDGVTAGQLDRDIPEWATLKLSTPPVASLWQQFEVATEEGPRAYLTAGVLFFERPEATAAAFELMTGGGASMDVTRESSSVRAASGFIGEQSLMLRSAYGEGLVNAYFTLCRAAVELHFQGRADDEAAMAYIRRLEQRLQAIDCEGAAEIPPPPTPTPGWRPPTPTPFPQLATSNTLSTTIQSRITGSSLHRPVFFDEWHGWLTHGTLLFASDDGGVTWAERGRLGSRPLRLAFSSPLDGLAETQLGWERTADGGRTWQPSARPQDWPEQPTSRPCGFGSHSFSTLGEDRWLVLCTPEDAWKYEQPKELLRSLDGGQTWERLAWSDNEEGGRLPFAGIYSGLYFLDEQRGWMVSGGLFRTLDGGLTWQRVPLDLPIEDGLPPGEVEYDIRAPYFVSPDVGFLINYPAYRYDDPHVLHRTADGGQTWAVVLTEPRRPPVPEGHFTLLDARYGLAFGTRADPGTVLVTESAGSEWVQVGSLSTLCGTGAAADVRGVSFVGREQGWALMTCDSGLTLLAGTADGGASWRLLAPGDGLSDGLAAISFVDAALGYAVTTQGRLLITRDGGASFRAVGGEPHVGPIQFQDERRGWQVREGHLYATTDGGVQWGYVPLGYWVDSFAVTPGGRMWVVIAEGSEWGAQRRLLTSDDRGGSWTEHQIWYSINPIAPYDFQPGTISMADNAHGWLSGGSDTLLFTADGGAAWLRLR